MGYRLGATNIVLPIRAAGDHMEVRDVDGTIMNIAGNLGRTTDWQRVPVSPSYRWRLNIGERMYYGRDDGTYSAVVGNDNLLVAYGGWFSPTRVMFPVGSYLGTTLWMNDAKRDTVYYAGDHTVKAFHLLRSQIIPPYEPTVVAAMIRANPKVVTLLDDHSNAYTATDAHGFWLKEDTVWTA